MSTFRQWLQQLNWQSLAEIVVIVLSSLICITFHELSHGYVAFRLGDPTAKRSGRLSVNPIKHIDPAGLVMMVLFRFGWAKPVPVDMRYFKKPKRDMALTALAGPLSNVILAFAAIVLFYAIQLLLIVSRPSQGLLLFGNYLLMFFRYTALLSVGLAVFNLIPIPPLDGSKILFSVLPDRAWLKLMRLERYSMILLIALLYLDVLDPILLFLRGHLLSILTYFPEELFFRLLKTLF